MAGRGQNCRRSKAHGAALADIEAQVKRLMGRTFVMDTPSSACSTIPRYLKAVQVRLDKLRANPSAGRPGDGQNLDPWDRLRAAGGPAGQTGHGRSPIDQFRWLLEELRVSLYAQELRTRYRSPSNDCKKQWEGIPWYG